MSRTLPIEQVSVGQLSDAKELSLLLPSREAALPFLLVPAGDKVMAVCLSVEHKFEAWEAVPNGAHSGIIITGLKIEIDQKSAFDSQYSTTPFGALVRNKGVASISVLKESFRQRSQLPILEGLTSSSDDFQAGFYRWSITTGVGIEKQSLLDIDVTPKTPM